jgi:hypothetical protein
MGGGGGYYCNSLRTTSPIAQANLQQFNDDIHFAHLLYNLLHGLMQFEQF